MSRNNKEKLSKWCLVALTGEKKTLSLREGSNSIGRNHVSRIFVKSKKCSKCHGLIMVRADTITYMDGSKRGTKILKNNQTNFVFIRKRTKLLSLLDQIWINDTGFQLSTLESIDLTDDETPTIDSTTNDN